jgi:Spy/CpxP family protein refolding chaperone
MRTLRTTLAALGVAALMASPAWAQGRGFGGGFGGPGALLSNKSVQQELKLDDKQAEKANELAEQIRTKSREAFESTSGLEGQERREKITELMKPINEEANKSIATILKPEQVKRYHQISLQQRGAMAFSDPQIQGDLKLTDDQKEKIRGIEEDSRGQMREIFQSAQGDRQAAMEKMTALRKETMDKVLGVLNDDQKKTWKEKTGEPFQVKFEPRPQQ